MSQPYSRSGRGRALALAIISTTVLLSTFGVPSQGTATGLSPVVVRALPGSRSEATRAVRDLGGVVGRRLDIIDGFVARLPAGNLGRLRVADGVRSVTPDVRLQPTSHIVDDFDQDEDAGSWMRSLNAMRTKSMWNAGVSGRGVDVALIDSGVAPVNGLTEGKIVNGPDLSFESQVPELRHLDSYGHGTHMAGIIAGRDDDADPVDFLGDGDYDDSEAPCVDLNGDGDFVDVESPGVDLNDDGDNDDEGESPPVDLNGDGDFTDVEVFGSDLNGDGDCFDKDVFYGALYKKNFVGVAPEARIVNVKVADASGATDVSQVIAAIDWVVQHRNTDGLNIRVLNLSYGTDGVQSYLLDPLTFAAEVAWRNGIVVVVAAGNSGFGSARLNNPAYDPFVIAVAANDTQGTKRVGDDRLPPFSARGNWVRRPDIVAPGKSIVSLRAPQSHADQTSSGARVGTERFFRGSGTSQSAAFVSGAAALLLQQRPQLTPDRVKALLMKSAHELPDADELGQGEGVVNLKEARDMVAPRVVQTWEPATGTGSLEAARGTSHLVDEFGNQLVGEMDIFGGAWDGVSWSTASASGVSWSGGDWNGRSWSGACFCADTWSGVSWSDAAWADADWAGRSWSGRSWSTNVWTGRSWSGESWDGSGGIDSSVLSGRSWSSVGWGL